MTSKKQREPEATPAVGRPAPGTQAAGTPADAAVLAAVGQLGDRLDRAATLRELGARTGYSPFHLQRRFRASTGLTPRELKTSLRLQRFRQLVRDEGVSGATYAAGFGSSRGLYEAAGDGLGMTPGQYARGGAGLTIAHTVETCGLGRVLVAHTARGVCAVLLGDDEADLSAELEREFPRARRTGVTGLRVDWVDGVLAHLGEATLALGVPLDVQGTPFQLAVWRALREIPRGETRSYGAIAASIGSPDAVRAVGTACGANTVAVLVPCHRVLRADGATGGYRWGVERKRALLARERVHPGADRGAPRNDGR